MNHNKFKKLSIEFAKVNCKDISNIINKNKSSVLIYILFNRTTNSIKIYDEKNNDKLSKNESYEQLGKKLASKRESKLINIFLRELYEQNITNGSKESLLKYLDKLGFNTNSKNKIYKKLLIKN